MLRDVLKKVATFGPLTHQNCVVGQKIATHATVFEIFLMWACFWHSLKDFKVGVAHPRCKIGRLSGSRLLSYLHRSIANPATRKSTQLNIGLKELKS